MRVDLVVPCFNEAKRINLGLIREFLGSNPHVNILFVNDGSTDETEFLLTTFCTEQEQANVQSLLKNMGKAEAVRVGMLTCLERGRADYIGYWDADLATPLSAVGDFQRVMEKRSNVEMVAGARVKLLGRRIVRRAHRHYLGRVFATGASVILGLSVYDTQCGAKLFRRTSYLQGIFSQPFISKWIFDVEILARLKQIKQNKTPEVIYEFPLWQWEDVGGSKLKAMDFALAAGDLYTIWRKYR